MKYPSIPDFLYVPFMPHAPYDKIVFAPKHLLYWKVFEFDRQENIADYLLDNKDEVYVSDTINISIHKRYPYFLSCFYAGKEIEREKIVKIGARAADWYAEHWIRENS